MKELSLVIFKPDVFEADGLKNRVEERFYEEITRAGLQKIRIADDGCGVDGGEVERVFMPHATSKIKTAKDLDGIGTLGFRGEAMSSIAAVSQVEFRTATDNGRGVMLQINGGEITAKKPIARKRGTEIIVQNLFYNTPARAKFLRSAGAEKNACGAVVLRAILSNPTVRFSYIADGEKVYDYRGKTLLDAIKAVYGGVTDENLLKIDVKTPELQLFGYVSAPEFSKRNRTYQVTIVNGRAVDCDAVAGAVNGVFENFLTVGNFPFFVLCLGTDLHTVDVNVHPRKAQVKFSNETQIGDFVRRAVGDAVDRHLVQKHALGAGAGNVGASDDEILKRIALFHNENVNNLDEMQSGGDHIMNMFDMRERGADDVRKPSAPEQTAMDTRAVDNVKIFGTIFNTYILAECAGKFHIIDQHAAQERVLFDRLCAQIDGGRVEKQRLLAPEILMTSPQDTEKMEDAIDTLNACGIECEPFGHNTFRITAVPVIVANHGVGVMLDAILGDVRVTKLSDLLRDKIVTQCCKAAVKAGQVLSRNELAVLVRDINDKKTVPNCPHGRPIIKTFTETEIKKMFARK